MQVLCPKCKQPLPPEDVNVAKDVAFCRACNEAFSLSAQVGSAGPPRAAQPADSRVILTRDAANIAVIIPAQGFKGTGCFFVFFSAFWNLITWAVFLGFLSSVLGVLPSKSPLSPWMLLIFIPHLSIGVVTALIAVYCVYGDVAIAMDRTSVLLQRRVFGYTWARKMPFDAITDVRLAESYRRNHQTVTGISFEFKGKDALPVSPLASSGGVKSVLKARTMKFGSGLSDGEKNWLVGEFHDFWRESR